MAKRNRAAIACARCKESKTKCSDFRPCKQCTKSNIICREIDSQPPNLAPDNTMLPMQGIQIQEAKNSLLNGERSGNFEEALKISCSVRRDDDTNVLPRHEGVQFFHRSSIRPSSLPRNSVSASDFVASFGLDGYGRSYQSLDTNFSGMQELVSRLSPATQTGLSYPAPIFAPQQASMGLVPLPQAVVDLLCELTRPIPHPPPPPNAFGILLAIASGISSLSAGHQHLPSQ